MIANYNKYASAVNALTKADNIALDTFKIALALTVTTTDTTFVAGTTDLATGNGYTAGGNIAAPLSANVVAGVMTLILDNPATWLATGTGFTFRYAILYNASTNALYGYWDYGSDQTITVAENVTVALDAVNGVIQVS